MERYTQLMDAVRILNAARLEVYSAEKSSPAWVKLFHAQCFLEAQAKEVLNEGN